MNHPGLRQDDDEADAADRAYGPAIVGFLHSFADPAVERRYLDAMAPQSQRRLAVLVWVMLLVSAMRMAAPLLGLFHDSAAVIGLLPRIAQIFVCIGLIAYLRQARRAATVELAALLFTVFCLILRCAVLPKLEPDGSPATIVGIVALLYFGAPLRISVLAPIMLAGSGAMLAAWSHALPAPSRAAIFQVMEWLIVVNLLGISAMRMMRFSLRRQWSLSQALRHLATHDGLTGIANRRHYDQVLASAWRRCRNEGAEISLVLLDVDFFKLLNDGIGHAAGDECLRDLALLLSRCIMRPDDLVARTGGEEFACLLPGTGEAGARVIAERIAAALREERMPHPDSPIGPLVTISLGVATAKPAQGYTHRDLTSLADRLVYAAKNAGRNCIRQDRLGPQVVAAETENVS